MAWKGGSRIWVCVHTLLRGGVLGRRQTFTALHAWPTESWLAESAFAPDAQPVVPPSWFPAVT